MICSNCRSTVSEDSRFCLFCGSRIDRGGLRLQKLRVIGAGGMVLTAAIFTALQGLLGIFITAWYMSLLELALAVSLFMIWKGCQIGHTPIPGLKLAMYTIFITIFGSCISFLGSTNMLIPAAQGIGSESYLLTTQAMGIFFVVSVTGLALTMWVLYFLFYRSLYLVASQKAQRIKYAGFVSVMYLITAVAAFTSILMLIPKDLRFYVNGGWSEPYVRNLEPAWMYINFQTTQWVYFLLQILFYICSGISSLLIGLMIKNIKKSMEVIS